MTLIESIYNMKYRIGLVSNSSSSSFIIIDKNSHYEAANDAEIFNHTLVITPNFCNMKFGWENVIYDSWREKLIFSYLQAKYVNNQQWLDMINDVMCEHLGIKNIKWNINIDDYCSWNTYAYIDHQSASYEGKNIEMFENKDVLKNFIFRRNSYIQGGNDNE